MRRFPRVLGKGKRPKRPGALILLGIGCLALGLAAEALLGGEDGLLSKNKDGESMQNQGEQAVWEQAQAGRKNEENRQILLSLGQSSDVLFLSWKGSKKDGGFLRISQNLEDLPYAEPIKAKKVRILQGKVYRYSVRIEDVEAGASYYYEIGDGVDYDPPRSFQAPGERSVTRFLYLGDVQFEKTMEEYDRWQKMIEKATEEHSSLDFAVIGGDMVNHPTEIKQWDGFLDHCQVFHHLPLMTVAGNHEGVHSSITYKKLFSLPQNGPKGLKEDFYFFDYGHCRFIMMDSSFLTDARKEKLGEDGWQQKEALIERWLKRVTSDSRADWKILVIHHPPYGMHDHHTVSADIRKRWTPIMETGEVDLVLCGHQHMYLRTREIQGITYVMGNSGGMSSEYYNGYNGPLYAEFIYGEGPNYQVIEAGKTKLTLRTYNEKGLVIDETSLRKGLRFHIFKFFRSGQVVV